LRANPALESPPDCSISELLERSATADPAAPALVAGDRAPLSYQALCDHVVHVGEQLARCGVGRGDRVAVLLPNGPDAATAFLGVASAAACAPLNPAYRERELAFYLDDLRPTALILPAGSESPARALGRARGIRVLELVAGEEAGRFDLEADTPTVRAGHARGSAPRRPPGDVALLLHTSGTTSRPKLVPLTHASLTASAENVARSLALGPGDRCLNVMPLFHIHGLVAALLSSLSAGASVICTPGFLAPRFLAWAAEHDATWYTAVPTMHQAILARAAESPELAAACRFRLVRSSSAALPVQVLAALEETFRAPVIEAYGMTEAAHQMASNPLPPAARKAGSVGVAAGPEVAVLDEAGLPLPAGTVGEVTVRGETIFAGYERNPEANAQAFTADGWFRTGDEGVLDEDGYLFLRGRIKEVINRGGEKIAPREVDEALLDHPAVAQAVAFAVPDALLGEEVGVAVVTHEGSSVSEAELRTFAASRLADFKVPRVVRLVDEIPLGPTGKLQRIGLASALGIDGSDGAGPVERPAYLAPRTAVEERLVDLYEEVLGLRPVGVHDDFFALGGDSMLGAELLARVHAQVWPGELLLTDLVLAPTPEQLAVRIWSGGAGVVQPLVPIRAEGARPPFFFVHGGDGQVANIAALGPFLDADQPFYALAARDRHKRTGAEPSIEAMAEAYLAEVRRVQASGPYFLGGLCTGGPVAIEMGHRLNESGEDVAFLVLLDPRVVQRRTAAYYLRRVGRRTREMGFRYVLGRVAVRARELPRRGSSFAESARNRSLRRMADATTRWRPVSCPARLTIFDTGEYAHETPRSFWEELGDGVDWHELSVPHEEMFRRGYVESLGPALADTLRRAQAETAP
jgi:acyl-CoA synthetase (AMP-forming)/AMP-acid ligase II/thioesterase domain-containing protein